MGAGEMRLVVDRVEDGEWAVLESQDAGRSFPIPRTWLPEAATEGDVLLVERTGDGEVRFTVDGDDTAQVTERMRALRESIPRGPSGDFEL
ncbi:MAG: DUF3006 domain-containing protein [Gemmatimonadota bacterium]